MKQPVDYLPLESRKPDSQYQNLLRLILEEGEEAKSFHPVGSISYMNHTLRYDLRNGIPLVTERSALGFWKSAIAELLAFFNGARTQKELLKAGVNERFWGPTVTAEKCEDFGLEEGDLGPGSYGPAMHAFPGPHGIVTNQIRNVIEQIRRSPNLRTHFISPWIPHLCVPSPERKRGVVVAPCHGWMHFKVFGNRLDLTMVQRSGDTPLGVHSNLFQYPAILMAVAHVLGMEAGKYYHHIIDAHIYNNQISEAEELITREPRPFGKLELREDAPTDIFKFRVEHFELSEYHPHPALKIESNV